MIKRYLILILFASFFLADLQGQSSFTGVYNYTLSEGVSVMKQRSDSKEYFLFGGGINWSTGIVIMVLMTTDENGNRTWDTIFNEDTSPALIGITQFPKVHPGYFAYGYNVSASLPRLLIISEDHKIIHDYKYTLANGQTGRIADIFLTKQGNELLTFGHGWPYFNPPRNCILLTRLDTSGAMLNYRYISHDTLDLRYVEAFQVKDSNEYDVFVFAEKNASKLVHLRVDSFGNILRTKLIQKSSLDVVNSVTRLKNGNFLVLEGIRVKNWGIGVSAAAVMLDTNGDSLYIKYLGTNTGDFKSIKECSNGDMVIVGDRRVIRIDSNFNTLWDKQLSNISFFGEASEAQDGGILVAGELNYPDSTEPYQNQSDWILIKMESDGYITSVKEIKNQKINTFTVYPNPAFDLLHISSKTGMTRNLKYRILDIWGRLELSGIISEFEPTINISELKTGIYVLELENPIDQTIEQLKVIKE